MFKARRMKWIWHLARTMEKKYAYTISVVEAKGKSPLGKPRHRWEHNIKIVLGEIGWDGMDWINLAQNRDQWPALVNTIMNFRVPQIAGNFLSS
jgi:hypothetical protein